MALLTFSLVALPLAAQDPPARPRITGIDHVRIYVSDVNKSREFYTTIIGLTASGFGCDENPHPCFLVNTSPNQQIELQQAPSSTLKDWLAEVAFSTTNALQMQRYLRSRGVSVGSLLREVNGAQHFEMRDPEGNPLSFIQRASAGVIHYKAPAEQIGTRIFHAGFVVRDAALEDRFYRQLLGFRMYWHGGFKDADVDWEEIQVPDGTDWIEYMLNIPANADHSELGVQNHFSLGVTDIKSTYARLTGHGLKPGDDKPEIGRDGKWSFDIYDPDKTRVEFMEFKPAQQPCCHPYEAPHPVP
jgi:catechol 2,3-dioxygenase-like lactoylglutathione lyase family enzyme